MRVGTLLVATALLLGLAGGEPALQAATQQKKTRSTGKRTPAIKKKPAPRPGKKAPATETLGVVRQRAARRSPVATAAVATTAPAPVAERRLTRDQRFRAAVSGARK